MTRSPWSRRRTGSATACAAGSVWDATVVSSRRSAAARSSSRSGPPAPTARATRPRPSCGCPRKLRSTSRSSAMKNHLKSLAVLAVCVLATPAMAGEAPRPPAANVIQSIGVSDAGGGVELEIRGTRAPSYTVFKLQDPPRLVVDLAGADVTGLLAVPVGRGGVREVTTAQYQDERSAVGRVIIALDGAPRYEVAPRGQAVVVRVAMGEKVATPTPTPSVRPERSRAAAESKDERTAVVTHRMDEAKV